LWSLRQADLQKGQRILIYDASGTIGTAAVQLVRYFEADVTAVCSTKNLELVRSMGTDKVIDYGASRLARWACVRAWVTRDPYLLVHLPAPVGCSVFATEKPLFVALDIIVSRLLSPASS